MLATAHERNPGPAHHPGRIRIPRKRRRQRHRPGAQAALGPLLVALSAHDDQRVRAARRTAARSRWAIPRSATSTSAPAAWSSRSSRASSWRSGTASWPSNAVFDSARHERRCETRSALHVLGLLSPGGVHSHEDQIFALIDMASRAGVRRYPGARLSRRPRYAAEERGRFACGARKALRGEPGAASLPSAVATTRWTATSAGSAPPQLTTC